MKKAASEKGDYKAIRNSKFVIPKCSFTDDDDALLAELGVETKLSRIKPIRPSRNE